MLCDPHAPTVVLRFAIDVAWEPPDTIHTVHAWIGAQQSLINECADQRPKAAPVARLLAKPVPPLKISWRRFHNHCWW